MKGHEKLCPEHVGYVAKLSQAFTSFSRPLLNIRQICDRVHLGGSTKQMFSNYKYDTYLSPERLTED